MREIAAILEAFDHSARKGLRTALATVVHLEGSSYRRPGARMLVTEEGEATGAISGGCLEGDALRKALTAISQTQSKLVTYDTSNEEDAIVGVQLGCEGIIHVLFEPIDRNNPLNPVELLRIGLHQRGDAVLATLFSLHDLRGLQPGTCLLLQKEGERCGQVPFPELDKYLVNDMLSTLQKGASAMNSYESGYSRWTAFLQYLPPPPRLVLVGAGNDAIPLMQIAGTLGWDVHVVDGRRSHARAERFAGACQVLVTRPLEALRQIPVDRRTAFVLMTHNYRYDIDMLKALLPMQIPYVGILGPRKRLDRMLEELQTQGFALNSQVLEKIHGPTGLDIGAETPEEIALSVLSEIQAVLTGSPGGMLREKQGEIHPRTGMSLITQNI